MSAHIVTPKEKSNPLVPTGEELLAIARGMKKDGYSDEAIAEQTKLPLFLIQRIDIKASNLIRTFFNS